jgi:ABC-type sugar transport system substrate-binding protein
MRIRSLRADSETSGEACSVEGEMGKARVFVSLLAQDQEFQRLQAADATETAAHHGLDVEIAFAENNGVVQIQQLFKAIHAPAEERPRAIVVETVTGEGLERVARNAVRAGVGWILLNRRVPYLAELAQSSTLPVSSVGTDQIEVGRIQGRQFRALRPRGGHVLYIQGPPDTSVAQERLAGARSAIEGAAIALTLASGLWTEESGEQAVGAFLRLKTWQSAPPDVVGCQNDSMAVGAVRALRAAKGIGFAGVPVTGCDGLQDGGRRLVDVKQLAATVVTRSNTGPAIELLAHHFKTGRPMPTDVLLPAASYPDEARLGAAAPRR